MEPITSADSAEVREAAAAAVAPDPEMASLLAKHSAGEKLSSSEYGKVGSWKQKLARLFSIKGGNGAQSAPAAPLPGQPAPMVPLAAAEAPDGGLAPVPL